ncbi:MAG: hypothetical protein AAFY03_09150, partial [Pseudomonadota bacterium]
MGTETPDAAVACSTERAGMAATAASRERDSARICAIRSGWFAGTGVGATTGDIATAATVPGATTTGTTTSGSDLGSAA